MRAVQSLTFKIGFCWWVLPYLRLIDHLTLMFGHRPDWDTVTGRILKGTYIEIGDKRIPLDL